MGKETNTVKLARMEEKIDKIHTCLSNHLKHHERVFIAVLTALLALIVGVGIVVIPGLF
jgi:hypothetical protein